jgi:glutamate synthase (NADPH/NADH) small chain
MPIVYPHKTSMPCRDAEERSHDWGEVAEGYTMARAMAEAQRCLTCQEPLCELGCPVNVPIRDFIHRVAVGDFAGAADTIRRRNLLPAICGRVCPVEHQCEAKCVLSPRQEPVGIGRLERFVADWEREQRALGKVGDAGQQAAPNLWRTQKIAVVGSGPAGLTAASDLAQLGYPVTVLEALHAYGGVLRYGIPQYRLPKEIVDENVERLEELGVEFVKDVIIGKTVTIDQLRDELGFDAVFVGTGAGSPIFMNLPGENLKGIYSANEFLTRVNLMHAFAFPAYDTPVRHPKKVAVIGAGDTAMDAVRCSIRLGAEEGHIVYRRSEQEKGARDEDYQRARDEGVIFDWLTLPKRFLSDEDGWVTGLECVRTELGEPDASGRRRPVEIPGSEFVMEADTVVIALGTNPNPLIPQTTYGLAVDSHGCIVADPETGATSREGVFAGGDIVTGAATVILAMGAGRKAATAIHEYLQQQAAQMGGEAVNVRTATREQAEVRRGYDDGLVWGRDYARPDEIDALMGKQPVGAEAEPYWRGFVDGAQEAIGSGGEPLVNG